MATMASSSRPPAPTRRPKRESEHPMQTRARAAIKKQKENLKLQQAYESLEIHSLICKRRWSTIIRRVQQLPLVVCISSLTTDGGYYTVLHNLFIPPTLNLRYSSSEEHDNSDDDNDDEDDDNNENDEEGFEMLSGQQERGEEQQPRHRREEREVPILPVIREVLNAADKIGYGVENGGVSLDAKTIMERCGSWNLLSDHNNPARQSPLHVFLCYEKHNKVAILKTLLQMDRDKTSSHHHQQQEHPRERQHEILSLLDLDNRNVLHYCVLYDEVISDESIAAIEFLLHHAPTSLLYQRDVNGKTPLDYVLQLLRCWSIQGRYGNDEEDDDDNAPSILVKKKSNYRVMKLLVHFMVYGIGRNLTLSTESENAKEDERDADRGVSVPKNKSYSKSVPWDTVNNHSLNVLQEACLLPRSILFSKENDIHCNLVSYLLSDDASWLEAAIRQLDTPTFNHSFINMAAEEDENGNHALHLFLSNESYRKINGEVRWSSTSNMAY